MVDKIVKKIAEVMFQLVYLVDDKEIEERWKGLQPSVRSQWVDKAETLTQVFMSDPNIVEIDPDPILLGVLQSLYDKLDAEKDLAELKALGYILDKLKAGWVKEKR
jgi:hypothetical protein